MKKVLPLYKPLVKAYKHHGFLIAMMGDAPAQREWVLGSYLQLFSGHDIANDPLCDAHWLDFLIIGNDSPFLNGRPIHLKELQSYDLNIFLKETIDQGSYLYVFCEASHLPHHYAYRNEYLPNVVLVYGYDEEGEERSYHILDYAYTASRKLEQFSLPADILHSAIRDFDPRGHDYAEYSAIFTTVDAE
jgi:hypothetical protein